MQELEQYRQRFHSKALLAAIVVLLMHENIVGPDAAAT
jgi:hypothetical protein